MFPADLLLEELESKHMQAEAFDWQKLAFLSPCSAALTDTITASV